MAERKFLFVGKPTVIGVLIALLGLPGYVDDLRGWRGWLQNLPMSAETTSLILVIIGFVIVLFANVSVLRFWEARPDPMTGSTDLASLVPQLVAELGQFVSERNRDDPVRGGHPLHGLSPRTSEKRRREIWAKHSEDVGRYMTETMNQYRERYAARALWVFDEAAEAGLIDPEERWLFELPTNSLGIEEIHRILGVLAERLRREIR